MIILGIETAGPFGGISLLLPEEAPRRVQFESARQLGAKLAPTIQKMVKAAGLGPRNPPDLVAVDLGPGSYTGLRIGLAAAKGLAFAWGRPLIGIAAAELLHLQAGVERSVCTFDASRGEVYATILRSTPQGLHTELEPGLFTPEALQEHLQQPATLLGDATDAFVDPERGLIPLDPPLAWPDPVQIALRGRERYLEGLRCDSLHLGPIYFRANEAEEARRKRSMRSA